MGALMRILKLFLPLALVCLIAAACSGNSDDSEPTVVATEGASQPTEAVQEPAPEPAEVAVPLSATQRELSDAIFTVMVEDDERPRAMAEGHIRCLADGLAGVFSDERLNELGLNGSSITSVYEDRGSLVLGDAYAITDAETSQLVDGALECVEWRAVLAAEIAVGIPSEQAECLVSEISDEELRLVVMNALIVEPDEFGFGLGEERPREALRACDVIREMFYGTLVQEGISEESARCVAEGLSDEVVALMTGGQEPESEEEVSELMGELVALQNRCLTPEEIESMDGSSSLS